MRTYTYGQRGKACNKALAVTMVGAIIILLADLSLPKPQSIPWVCAGVLLAVFGLALMTYVGSRFKRCEGSVLEVLDGKVVTHHAEPFYYKLKELGGVQLVSVPMDAFSVSKKVFFTAGQGVASFELECFIGVVNWQNFYDAFLRQGECQTARTPKEVAELSLRSFLKGYFFFGKMYYDSGCSEEFVCVATTPLAEAHLQRQLATHGLGCSMVKPKFQNDTHFIL
ncbi:MAG: hypothetical protein UT41_C0001G0040 [Candidatus Wolfebacteria bacterium GW2011_GWC2_39_22]|uniref:Uncharacterized protein n=2 Tax=Candidatus Wolfeibacteriota TaxID=1752735 RepID=A0A0G1HA81_9BACT|nr:MAG: hypothetical protein UT41_C0001G0040 [Candidatus Wolfebacteria bacterium GW2011_GWC2_39_22]KKT43453.1 MAG: hypothetical protein UW32_C0001G0045 [Candidatus Wolfebacteria bacterium GW2011_GWE2_44_13]